MPPTTRERLERSVSELKSLAAKADATSNPPAQLLGEIAAKTKEVESNIAARSAQVASEGQKAVDADSGRTFRGQSTDGLWGVSSKALDGELGAPSMLLTVDQLDDMHKGVQDRRMVSVKATLAGSESPGYGAGQYFDPNVLRFARETTRILDLIPIVNIDGPQFTYWRQTTGATAAATVAEGANKPESSPVWETVLDSVSKIAHYARINEEVIWDNNAFRQVIAAEMVAGLIAAENAQVLNGDGIGENLTGLTVAANINSIGSAGTDIDAVLAAANTIRTTAFVEPTHVLIHPNDWSSTGFAAAKDSAGNYLLGDAVTSPTPRLWGLEVVQSTQVTENTLIVANLRVAAKAFVRMGPTFEVAPSTGSEFIANQVLARAEERIGLAVVQPKAICLVTAV